MLLPIIFELSTQYNIFLKKSRTAGDGGTAGASMPAVIHQAQAQRKPNCIHMNDVVANGMTSHVPIHTVQAKKPRSLFLFFWV
mmetsp:Transcript_21757/g.51650  ORF Transcript_21757/g.51650 Transcript_21757/m.51650 type:complete len:83 (-) Transcript_21757:111-359(-)